MAVTVCPVVVPVTVDQIVDVTGTVVVPLVFVVAGMVLVAPVEVTVTLAVLVRVTVEL